MNKKKFFYILIATAVIISIFFFGGQTPASKKRYSTKENTSSFEIDIPKFYITGNLSEMYNKEERRIVQFSVSVKSSALNFDPIRAKLEKNQKTN